MRDAIRPEREMTLPRRLPCRKLTDRGADKFLSVVAIDVEKSPVDLRNIEDNIFSACWESDRCPDSVVSYDIDCWTRLKVPETVKFTVIPLM
ncbi:hypothetical protein RUM43_013703 [Polyplax serrata]|uniref:Uncharacterized protein n=1 Tax=Polyplax serrata TaxID=468196 RepID=A0AAN8P5L8_POLSC